MSVIRSIDELRALDSSEAFPEFEWLPRLEHLQCAMRRLERQFHVQLVVMIDDVVMRIGIGLAMGIAISLAIKPSDGG
jgi:hypothetical protein